MDRSEVNRLLADVERDQFSREQQRNHELELLRVESERRLNEAQAVRSDTLDLAREASGAFIARNIPEDIYIEEQQRIVPFTRLTWGVKIIEGWAINFNSFNEELAPETGGGFHTYYDGYILLPAGQLFRFSTRSTEDHGSKIRIDCRVTHNKPLLDSPYIQEINSSIKWHGKEYSGINENDHKGVMFREQVIQKDIAEGLISRGITSL